MHTHVYMYHNSVAILAQVFGLSYPQRPKKIAMSFGSEQQRMRRDGSRSPRRSADMVCQSRWKQHGLCGDCKDGVKKDVWQGWDEDAKPTMYCSSCWKNFMTANQIDKITAVFLNLNVNARSTDGSEKPLTGTKRSSEDLQP